MTAINHTVLIETDTLAHLDSWARIEGRTLNEHIERLLKQAVREYKTDNMIVLHRHPGEDELWMDSSDRIWVLG